MQMRRREAGQGGGWGCGPDPLAATVPCALFIVDLSQWRGAHSLWPCSVNIQDSGCSGGSPGALYLNDIILYIDIYIISYILLLLLLLLLLYILSWPKVIIQTILWISNDCVGFSDASGSSTSTSISSRLNRDMAEKGIIARDCLQPEPLCPLTPTPRKRAACLAAVGSGQRAEGIWRETITGNNPFLFLVAVHVLQGVKAEVPFPPIPSQPWLR